MRSHLLARRIAAPALGLALVATMAACSLELVRDRLSVECPALVRGGAWFRRAEQPGYRVDSRGGGADHGELGEVLQLHHSAREKSQAAAERGRARVCHQGLFHPAPGQRVGAKVTTVAVNSATKATVTYDITAPGGSALLSNQTGTSVYQDGIWKVGDRQPLRPAQDDSRRHRAGRMQFGWKSRGQTS